MQAHRGLESARNKWTLCVRPSLLAPAELLNDREYQKLSTGGDWGIEVLGAAQAQDLQSSQGAQWALLAPDGSVAGVGQGRPKGVTLLDTLHASGAKARYEARDAFLKDNPDQGEALVEALAQELRLLRAQVASLDGQGKVKVPAWHPEPGTPPNDDRITLAGADGDAKADELYAGAGEALLKLTQTPHWTREAQWTASRVATFDLGQATFLRRFFSRLAPELEEEAAADPMDPGLIQMWMEALDGARLLPEGLSGKMLAAPGSLWPSAQILPTLLEPFRRRKDWEGELNLLTDLTPDGPPEPMSQRGWDEYCELQSAILAHKTAALASQGSWDQARATLDEALKWGGSRSVQMALMRRGTLDPSGDSASWRRLLGQLASRNQQRPLTPRLASPLRLTLLGRPSWLISWTLLRNAPDLVTWSPGELQWDIATPAVHAEARARFGWNGNPRWVLFQGDEMLATGETLPEAKALAAVLAGHGAPMLERMARVLALNPRHLPTRRARFHVLLNRMPEPRLESLLVEDAASARLPLIFEPRENWKPDEALWAGAAQTVLPALETELRSWPGDADLWQAWISWARFHPARPSIISLANGLQFWSPGGDWKTTLPYDVQRAVAAELRRQGSFLVMREWFQAAWELLDHRPQKDLRPWEKGWVNERRAEEETAIYQPLRDAYRALGMTEQQVELEKTFAAMTGRGAVRGR